jgi:hypothetical protein
MLTVSGQVIETMDGGGYTYALVKNGSSKTWVAMPKTTIVRGNEITCRPGMMMNNFSSTALKRTFRQIVFSQGVLSSSPGNESSQEEILAEEDEAEAPAEKPVNEWPDKF